MPVDRTRARRENSRVRDAIAFVRLGYGDNFGLEFRSLNFRTEELTTAEAQAVLRIIEYNEFDGEKVAEAIGKFKGKIASYEFGREGSPVLYIRLPYWTSQREGKPPSNKTGKRIDDTEINGLVAEFEEIFVGSLGAIEFGLGGAPEYKLGELGKRIIRVLWD